MSEAKNNIRSKMAKLDELVAWFDGDDFELEAALAVFAEAKELVDSIDQDLLAIKNEITVVNEQFDRDKE